MKRSSDAIKDMHDKGMCWELGDCPLCFEEGKQHMDPPGIIGGIENLLAERDAWKQLALDLLETAESLPQFLQAAINEHSEELKQLRQRAEALEAR